MNSDLKLAKYNTSSATAKCWHIPDERGRSLCYGAADMIESKTIGEMTDRELANICIRCLRKPAHEFYPQIEQYNKRTKPLGADVSDRPLCPNCNNSVSCGEAKGSRLSWWQEGRKWKCFSCNKRYTHEQLDRMKITQR